MDTTNESDMIQLLLNECRLAPEVFQDMFPDCYTLPHLKKDAEGFIINSGKYTDFAFFETVDGRVRVIHDPKSIPDPDLESNIGADLTEIKFDLKLGENRICVKNRCYVYPETIHGTPVYDIIVYTDVLFKYIWSYLRHTIFIGKEPQLAGAYDYIISHAPGTDGLHHIRKTHKRDGFSGLKNAVHMFLMKHKGDLPVWREKYKLCGDAAALRVGLHFPTIEYATSGSSIYINPRLTPEVDVGRMDGVPIQVNEPGDVVRRFFEEHYGAVREAFPIYKRAENIYKIMMANRVMRGNFAGPADDGQMVYTGDIMDSIAFNGGIRFQPKTWAQVDMPTIPFKEHQIIQATQKNIDLKVCKEAFDNGGFICAFAPKLKIRDCYEKNLNDFHECLSDEKN